MGRTMIDLDDDTERGIQLFMAEYRVSRDEAVRRILRDWLTGGGYIPRYEREVADAKNCSSADGFGDVDRC